MLFFLNMFLSVFLFPTFPSHSIISRIMEVFAPLKMEEIRLSTEQRGVPDPKM